MTAIMLSLGLRTATVTHDHRLLLTARALVEPIELVASVSGSGTRPYFDT